MTEQKHDDARGASRSDAVLDEPQPLLWMCKCGWVGTVAKMDKDYCCPACGGFSTLSVVMFRQARVLGNVCV